MEPLPKAAFRSAAVTASARPPAPPTGPNPALPFPGTAPPFPEAPPSKPPGPSRRQTPQRFEFEFDAVWPFRKICIV